MKKILLPFLVFLTTAGFSQDSLKIRQIDSLVKQINQSGWEAKTDSILQDHPELGLSMRTHLATVMKDGELKKYVNRGYTTRIEKGISRQMTTENAFYFDQHKLIKVEEYGGTTDKQQHFHWYYSDGKPLYYTYVSGRSEGRAALLLTMADAILKQIEKL